MRASALLFAATTLPCVAGVPGEKDRPHHVDKEEHGHDHVEETCYGEVTVVDTKTVLSTTVVPTTCYVEVTDFIYVNTTITQAFTENSTTTFYHTVDLTDTKVETETETDVETVKVAVTETDTDSVTVTTTGTDAVTITTTDTDGVTVTTTDTDAVTVTTTDTDGVTITTTDTVPATITTYTTETETLLQTTYDPCPKSCSIDAATVTLFYWPSDRPYSYPSTYVDSDLDYTFVSPSVYMLIPSAKGTNSRGQHVGPSTTNWILGLDLDEVSTIADGPSGSLTRQLELSDLGTNCPQSVDPTAIATLSDSRCAPVLAAPTTVSSWAYPCNACGRFGLFDPPYAVPTVTGLIEPTSTTAATTTRETTTAVTTAAPITTTTTSAAEPTGTIYIVYHEDGQPKSTETLQSAGISGETTRSVALSLSSSESSTPVPVPDGTETSEVLEPPTITPTAAPSTLPTPSDPDTITAAAHRVHSGSGPVHAAIAIAFSIIFLFSL